MKRSLFLIYLGFVFLLACDGFKVKTGTVVPTDLVATESTAKCELHNPGGNAAPSGFWGGLGSALDPFQICTAAQLNLVSNNYGINSYFILINDIDLDFLLVPFNMITLASGSSFDGQGNKIKNLNIDDAVLATWGAGFIASAVLSEIKDIVFEDPTINLPESEAVALIGDTQSVTISDIQITGLSVTGKETVGGVVGNIRDNNNGLICERARVSNVTVSGSVTAIHIEAGGIVGQVGGWCNLVGAQAGIVTVELSSFTGTVSSPRHVVGGIVGSAFYAEILNVTANAIVSGQYGIGGILGEAYGEVNITASSGAGQVNGTLDVGGICGNATSSLYVLNTSTDSDVTSTSEGGRLFGSFSTNYGSTSVGTTSTGMLNGNAAGLLIGFEYP